MVFRLIGFLLIAWLLAGTIGVVTYRKVVRPRLRDRHLAELEAENARLDALLAANPPSRRYR